MSQFYTSMQFACYQVTANLLVIKAIANSSLQEF